MLHYVTLPPCARSGRHCVLALKFISSIDLLILRHLYSEYFDTPRHDAALFCWETLDTPSTAEDPSFLQYYTPRFNGAMRLTACPRRLILLRRPKITAAMLAVNGVISTILNIRRMMLQNRYAQGKSIRGMYVQSKLRFNCPVSIADHPLTATLQKPLRAFLRSCPSLRFGCSFVTFHCLSTSEILTKNATTVMLSCRKNGIFR